jgi:hypothetical protein
LRKSSILGFRPAQLGRYLRESLIRLNSAILSGGAHAILSCFLRVIERSVSPFDEVAGSDPGRRDGHSDARSDPEVRKILFASLVGFDALTDSLSNNAGALRGSARHHDRELFSPEARAYIKDTDGSAKDL